MRSDRQIERLGWVPGYKDPKGVGSALLDHDRGIGKMDLEEALKNRIEVSGWWLDGTHYPRFVHVTCRDVSIGSFEVRRIPTKTDDGKLGYILYIDDVQLGGTCAGPRLVRITLGEIWL